MKAYIQSIDLTKDGRVKVIGNLPSTNLDVKLIERYYNVEPEDGFWGYDLEVLSTSHFGAQMLIPFIVEAPWTGNENASGLRIEQPALSQNDSDHETVLMKVRKVGEFTTKQNNHVMLKGAFFDKSTKQLIIDLSYSGGCFTHVFSLEWDGTLMKSEPPQYGLRIIDKSEYDPCKAIKQVQLRIDLDTPDFQLKKPSILVLSSLSGSRQLNLDVS